MGWIFSVKFCLSCLLRVLLVSGALAMQSADEAAVEGLRGGDSAEVEAGVGGLGLRTEELSWDDLRGRVAGGGYRAMELGDYRRLLRECEVKGVGMAVPARPWIRRAEYEAEFRGGALTGGRLKFFLYGDEDVQREHVAPLPGLTNLRRLRLFDAHGELPLGADLERRLYVLKPGVSGDVSGTWEADGVVSGESVGFRLEFPASTTSRLELRTGADIEVTATGSLVSGRVDGAGGIIWTLIPSESARMSFVCRRSVGLATGDPVLFASFGAWHALQGDILNSRWTLGLPGGAFGGSQLSFRLSLGTRVLGVSTEDQRLLSWESVPDATAQTLRVTLPAEGLSGAFSVQCASVIEQLDRWELPALVPRQWQRGEELRGPLLSPAGPVTVTLPTTLRVDEWGLTGMQERDVIAGPDLSQTFQLIQFLPEAAAFVRTSVSAPQVTETVVHLAESVGQSETVRSYVNLSCTEASLVELEWPVAEGWDVISVRYASTGRSLLFDTRPTSESGDGSTLRVYFPETLEAGSSRVLEFHFQGVGEGQPGSLQLPLSGGGVVQRGEVYLLWEGGRGSVSGVAERWSAGRPEFSLGEFRLRMPWFPEQRLRDGMRCCQPGSGAAVGAVSVQEAPRGVVEDAKEQEKDAASSGDWDRILVRASRQFHLLDQTGGRREQEVLALMELDCGAGVEWCETEWVGGELPLIFVGGRGVRGEVRNGRLRIPLPVGGGRCELMLMWKESGGLKVGPEWRVRLRSMSLWDGVGELNSIRTVYAVLSPADIQIVGGGISTGLTGEGVYRDWSGVAGLMERGLGLRLGAAGLAGLRQFVSRWELATAEGVEQRFYVDDGVRGADLELRAVLRQRSAAAATGAGLVCFGFFVGLAGWLSRRLPWASLPVGLSSVGTTLADESFWGMVLRGCFWGGCAGMVLVMLLHSGRRVAGRLRVKMFVWLLVLGTAASGSLPVVGQDDFGADVLMPKGEIRAVEGVEEGLVFVSEAALSRLREASAGGEQSASGEGLIESVRTRVLAESGDRIELNLEIKVVVRSGEREAVVRLPLGGNRLVSCLLDGVPILPETEAGEQLLVRLPPSVAVPVQELAAGRDGVAAAADERAAFTGHRVEIRLWPLLSRQSAVVQFRLPGLPSPRSTIEIVSAGGLYSGARLQTEEGVFQWDPSAGEQELNGLSMRGGADLRLLQAGLEKGVAVPATVEGLVIAENSTGLQQLTLLSRFRDWNPLKGELRFRVPSGYRLLSVKPAAGLNVSEILWLMRDQQAFISLPAGHTGEFVLELALSGQRPLPVLRQQIPAAELLQFADCIPAARILAAIRNSSVLALTAPLREQAEAVAFSAESERWGTWLRRTDSLLRVPKTLALLEVKLEPRASRHEVRMTRACTVRDQELLWTCRMDVETSQVPVFRHRISLPAAMQVTDVQVTSGEATRLQSWHRRGELLTIQLREGTTGLHGIELSGRMELRADDSQIRLLSPHLDQSQILESTLTLRDETTVGLQFADVGATVPVEGSGVGRTLKAGEAIRLQVTNESPAVVLERLKPVDPTGRAAVVRAGERVILVMRFSNWSSRLGPLRLVFADGVKFLSDPVVLTERGRVNLEKNGEVFETGQKQLESLFGVSEFSVAWSAEPLVSEAGAGQDRYCWPEVSDRIQWTEVLYGPTRRVGRLSGEYRAENEELPAWATSAAEALGWVPGDEKRRGLVRLSLAEILQDGCLVLPVSELAVGGEGEGQGGGLAAFTSSTAVMDGGRPGFGKTDVLIVCRRYPLETELVIPEGLVLRDVPDELRVLSGEAGGNRYQLKLTGPLTRLRLHWLNALPGASLLAPELKLELPHLANGAGGGVLRLGAAAGERLPGVEGPWGLISAEGAQESLSRRVAEVLAEADISPESSGLTGDVELDAAKLAAELVGASAEGLELGGAGESWFAVEKDSGVEFAVRQRLDLQRILTGGIGLLICAAAFLFAASGRAPESEVGRSVSMRASVSVRSVTNER